jgi:hypothetical protein
MVNPSVRRIELATKSWTEMVHEIFTKTRDERYREATHLQRVVYWVVTAGVLSFIGYVWIFKVRVFG